jgi:outer membrane receptor for ferrienterochelin and colicin
VRGIAPNDNDKLGLLINGHNVANVNHTDLLNGPLDLSIAERVEVIVGPGSVLYGAETLMATINIITHKATTNDADLFYGNVTDGGTFTLGSRTDDEHYMTAQITSMHKNGWDA